MKFSIKAGSTSETVDVFVQNGSTGDGSGLTGLVFNTVGLTCYYNFPRSASTAVTLATLASAATAWSSGGFVEIDSTNQKGKYRLDIPNALLASGNGRYVGLTLQGAANMAPVLLEIELTGWDNQDSVRGGMTALPSANAEAAGGLYTRGTGAGQINQPASGQIDANTVKISGTVQTARDLGAGVLLASGSGTGQILLTSGAVTVGTNNDKTGYTASTISDKTGYSLTQTFPSNFALLAIDGSGDVTVATNNDKTGYALSAAQSPILESGTAQTGGASTITLRSGASATDNLYRGLMLRIYGGAGAGQARVITGYVGSSKIATVDNAWVTNPDVTSTYAIVGHEAPWIDSTGSVKIQIPLKRNTAQPVFPFTMRDTLGNLASGLVVSAQVTIDGAALIATTNAPTELGSGWYLLNLAAADLNGTAIGLRFSAAGATVKDIEIFTQP